MDIDKDDTDTDKDNKDIENQTKINSKYEFAKNKPQSKALTIFLVCMFGLVAISFTSSSNEGSLNIDSGNTISLKDNNPNTPNNSENDNNSYKYIFDWWQNCFLFFIIVTILAMIGVIVKLWNYRRSKMNKLNKLI